MRTAGQVTTLRAAYSAARYRILAPAPFELQVGRPSGALRAVYCRYGMHSAAVLTACNPGSRRMGQAWNRAASQRLLAQLLRRHRHFLPGRAEDPIGRWPDEVSMLVLGISRHEAVSLARQFAQNALLLIAADAVPRLHWLSPAHQAPVGRIPNGR